MICLLNLNLSGALGDESEKRRFHMSQAPWVVSKAVENNDRQILAAELFSDFFGATFTYFVEGPEYKFGVEICTS